MFLAILIGYTATALIIGLAVFYLARHDDITGIDRPNYVDLIVIAAISPIVIPVVLIQYSWAIFKRRFTKKYGK